MLSKKELLKKATQLQEELIQTNKMLATLSDEFTTLRNVTNKAFDESQDMKAQAMSDTDRILRGDGDELLQIYNYMIPSKYTTEYYWRATSVNVFGYFATSANVVSHDERLSNLDIYGFILWSVMFGNFGIGVNDDKLSIYVIENREGDKIKASLWSFDKPFNNIRGNKLVNDNQEVEEFEEGVNFFSLNLFWDGVGYWIRCIPDLAREIYWERARDDVAGLLTIIPVQDSINPNSKHVANRVFYDKGQHVIIKQDDKQNRGGSQADRVWIIPPAEANELYNTLTANYNFWKQTWRHKIGIPFGNTQGANSGDDFRDNYQTPKLALMRPIWDFFKNLKEKLGLDLEIKEDYFNEENNDMNKEQEGKEEEGNNEGGEDSNV